MPGGKTSQFFCELPDGTIAGLPCWMMDSSCELCALGRPLIALEALRDLRDLLNALQDPSECDKASLKPPEGGAYDKTDEA